MTTQQRAVSAAWGDWIAGMGEWHLFGALTYDRDRRTTVPGNDVAKRQVDRWLREGLGQAGRRVSAAVVALEYQKAGWPHFHPLLRLAGGLQPGDIARLGEWWYEHHGYAELSVPRVQGDVAAYAAKYLSKDLGKGDVTFWPRRGSLSLQEPGF